MSRFLWVFVAALALLARPAAAQERITNYFSDVAIQPDSSLEVTETIDVRSEGDRIRHGIYRDFPTLYSGRNGSRIRVGFDFKGAERDGKPEEASIEPLSNGVRIRLGSADTLIEPGDHRYIIRYRTTRQLGRFKDYDELYWNATGNGWMFPIDAAEARIRLPSPARFGQRAAYTGPEGSTDGNAAVVSEEPGEIMFQTTMPLGAYEGLTVAVAFPKGIVGEASDNARLGWWLRDNGPPIVGALALALILGFYFVAWQRAGRDPTAGTVVPLFTPPDDLSPAGMRYVVEQGSDNRAFAAALVDMGVRGHIRISEEDGGWLSRDKRLIERLPGKDPLPEDEQAALGQLLSTGEIIAMKQENHEKFSSAKSELNSVLKKKYEGRLFKRNYGWAAAGLGIFIVGLWLSAAAVALASGFASPIQVAVAIGAAVTAILFMLLQSRFAIGGKCLLYAIAILFAVGAAANGVP
jgi:hypothetical protein